MGSCVQKQQKVASSESPKKSFTSILATPSQLRNIQHIVNNEESDDFINKEGRIPSKGKLQQGSLIVLGEKVVFEGFLTNKKQQGFEDKRMSISNDMMNADILCNLGISVSCKKGLKANCPNQDDYVIVVDGSSLLIGVFDGHGPFGHEISNYVHKTLPDILTSHPLWSSDITTALKESFILCQTSLINDANNPNCTFDCTISGTTATLIYITNNLLYSAHIGDSRAILAKKSESLVLAFTLTEDHQPNLPGEIERIQNHGGEIRRISKDNPFRIFKIGEEYPGLNMSRSFGDTLSHELGVICEPDIKCIDLNANDLFVLLCSDGVWEFISNQEAAVMIQRCNDADPKKASEKLAALAWMRWKQNFSSVVDDITVIIVSLKSWFHN